MAASISQTLHKKRSSFSFTTSAPSLPLSNSNSASASASSSSTAVLRRRLSSISLPSSSSATAAASWAFNRSKSLPAVGAQTCSSVKRWWDSAWGWILSRKPAFAQDLEMNEEETKLLGYSSRGSWRHVFYKVRFEIRKLTGFDHAGLPQTCRYDSFNYAKNFDDGRPRFQR